MQARAVIVCAVAAALCAIFSAEGVASASHIRLNTRYRYEDILIAFEDEELFDKGQFAQFQQFLTQFSSLLGKATAALGRRISAEVIRVLVPAGRVAALKAAGYSFTAATWESDDTADVRIISSSNSSETVAYPADTCRGAGRRILAPTSNVKKTSDAFSLVREFAKHRWGVLSEVPQNLHFYYDSDYVAAVCSPKTTVLYTIKGGDGMSSSNTDKCMDAIIGADIPLTLDTFDSVCEMSPKPDSTDQASLLSNMAVAYFCTNSTGTLLSHNKQFVNPHNMACNYSSAAEVIWGHPDFAGDLAGSPSALSDPTVLLIEPNGFRKIVMVLDLSGSMAGPRITNLIRAATLYVKYFVETGAEMAIVTFNETAFVFQPMLKISNDTVRKNLAATIQTLAAQGWTNIADGITEAMTLLGATKPYNKNQTGFVVLLTDGEHNRGPSLEDSISNASLTSIVFDTVTISSQADARMQLLSTSTGGWAQFSSQNVAVNTELEEAFAMLSQRSKDSGQSRPVLLRSSVVTLPIMAFTVTVEDSVKKSLNFMLYLPNLTLANVNVTVQSPLGKVFGSFSGSSVYQIETAISTIIITIPDGDIVMGNWTTNAYSIAATGRRKREADSLSRVKRQATSSTGSVVVLGGTSGGSLSVNMDVWLRTLTFSQVTVASVQKIYAYITNSSAAITNAVVQANIVPANGSAFSVTLYDDGLGTDLTARDGIYVAQILPDKLNTTGDYAVTVTMTSPVSRVASAGKFRVEALATGPVTLPPGRVVDLAIAVSFKNQSLAVRFTSPGGQSYDATSPASYELRASNSFDQVAANFDSARLIARLLGQPSGSKVQATLLPSNFSGVQTNTTFYLAVLSTSAAGLRGQTSFPIGASFSLPNSWVKALARRAASSPQPVSTTTATPDDVPWTPGTVAGVAVLTIVLIAQCVVIIVVSVVVK